MFAVAGKISLRRPYYFNHDSASVGSRLVFRPPDKRQFSAGAVSAKGRKERRRPVSISKTFRHLSHIPSPAAVLPPSQRARVQRNRMHRRHFLFATCVTTSSMCLRPHPARSSSARAFCPVPPDFHPVILANHQITNQESRFRRLTVAACPGSAIYQSRQSTPFLGVPIPDHSR